MANYIDQATLLVKDSSTAQINKINAALRKLFATAKALKNTNITIKINARDIDRATASVKRLKSELAGLKSVANVNVKASTNQLKQASAAAQQLTTNLRAVSRTRAQVTMNSSAIQTANNRLNRLHANARRPVVVQTQMGGGIPPGGMPPRGGGVGGRGGPIGRGIRGAVGGMVGGYGYDIPYAIGRGLARQGREGAISADIGETALALRQLSVERRKIADEMIKKVMEQQMARPGGSMYNRGQVAKVFAEMMGVTREGAAFKAGGIEGSRKNMDMARFLTDQTLEFRNVLFYMGKTFEESAEGANQYVKAMEMANTITDKSGQFDIERATRVSNFIRGLIPTIGEEATGQFFRQNLQYLRSSRFSLAGGDFRGLALSAFLGEEMRTGGPAGLEQLIKQGTAISPGRGKRGGLLAAPGLTLTALKAQRAFGYDPQKMFDIPGIGRISAGDLLGRDPLAWGRYVMKPLFDAAKLDTQNADAVGKQMRKMFSHGRAADVGTGIIHRLDELENQWENFKTFSGDIGVIREATKMSVRQAGQAVENQLEGALGQMVLAASPILVPAFEKVSGVMASFGESVRKASEGDKTAQNAIARGAFTTALGGVMAAPGMAAATAMAGGIAGPLGLTAGLTAAVGTTGPIRALALAGASLNAAAIGLQGAAAAQLAAAGVAGAPILKRMLPFLGVAGAIAIGAGAGSAGPGSPGYEYQIANPATRKRMEDLARADTDHYNSVKRIAELEKKVLTSKGEERKQAVAQFNKEVDHLKAIQQRRDELATTEQERIERGLALLPQYEEAAGDVNKRIADAFKLFERQAVEGPYSRLFQDTRTTGAPIWARGTKPSFGAPAPDSPMLTTPPGVSQLAELPSTFDETFSAGATAIAASGVKMGDDAVAKLIAGAVGVGSSIGDAFVARAQNAKVTIDVRAPGGGAGPDAGSQSIPTNSP